MQFAALADWNNFYVIAGSSAGGGLDDATQARQPPARGCRQREKNARCEVNKHSIP
jgi:hypothetical protein